MDFKALFFASLVAISSAAPPQYAPHSHAQITMNKATTHRDTVHDPSEYSQKDHQPRGSTNANNHYQYKTPVYHQSAQTHQYSSPAFHIAPVVQHVAPVVHHVAPVVQHVSPVVQHFAPAVHHVSPVVHHVAPVVQHVAPAVHHIAPVVQHIAPVVQHIAPVVQHVAPAVHASHSQSSSSHKVATPVHYAAVAKVALAPVAKYVSAPQYHHEEEEYGPAEYSFEYSVHDEHTGDIKSQKEERHGDKLQGSYMLIEPDGSRRIVEYSVDGHSGFNAVVHREEVKHPVVLKKVVAPVAVKYVAPIQAYHH